MDVKILRIDLGGKTYGEERLEVEGPAGGRYLTSWIVREEVPPRCGSLSAENKLVLACGPLAGRGISSAGRLSVGCKSPLTGGIKEANAGGTAADALARLGLSAIVLEGQSPEWVILIIDGKEVSFLPAAPYLDKGNYEVARRLREEFGQEYAFITLGPAGERKLWASGVAVSDIYGRPSRIAARGGVGAVMGSKRVKAILLAAPQGETIRPADPARAMTAKKEFHRIIATSERAKVLAEYGTAETMGLVQALGALPTRNFREGRFEQADKIDGRALYNLIKERGGAGRHTERCMASCLIRCSNAVPGPDGREVVAPLEYETLGLMGSNLGVGDLDAIARWNYYCNDLGVDTIEVGAALGVMAEAGLARFGDVAGLEKIILEIYRGTLVGRLAGMGAAFCGLALGIERVPAVKNQAISAYDPRGVKGTGITYATSPMGADHTAGLTVFAPVDHHASTGQKELSYRMQLSRAAYDALGLCAFLLSATGPYPEKVSALLNAYYGTELGPDYLSQLGARVIALEVAFNREAGLPEAEEMPAFMREEKLGPYDLIWDIPSEELQDFWRDLPAL
ncbi:aldehyde ferredoxin oxidoreductase C-terminal domain-containing protein [Thermanaeromonas sp. C210]|uniref:aldehyde ferredoxin oxidoreductase C-terminal domain-containing protein n=1 Tax=Thermanaeromonas sp. C210 TaxID=2731925 RepID=UPI00155D414F|nr:aldehyde ferredoxin oxidoreductase C-terminal domain-containing protein [Thermanaeromonas sp. C210]GFN22307.1 aldehyde ferredoxin oxidoreductase [Thermanaeromonas sp. C210]